MKSINVKIEGTTPLICNRFTDEAQMNATKGSRSAAAGGDTGTPLEKATPKLYTSHNGNPMIPQPNLFRCIIDAGKFHKAGKSKITTQKSSLIPAGVSVDPVEIEIEHNDPWVVDTRAVRIPSTGGRILTHRPMFHDWRLSFTCELDESLISVALLREIMDSAGRYIGLGDFRPDCKGPFGKFNVVLWDVQNAAEAA